MSLAALMTGSLPQRTVSIDSPPKESEVASSHGYQFGLPDQLKDTLDSPYVDDDDDFESEDEPEPITLQPGAHRQAVVDSRSVPEQLERLQAWE